MISRTAWPYPVRRMRGPMFLLASLAAALTAGKALAALPFDAARFGYASAVKAGLVENSMLASRNVERTLAALERATLGPLARRV